MPACGCGFLSTNKDYKNLNLPGSAKLIMHFFFNIQLIKFLFYCFQLHIDYLEFETTRSD